MVEGLVEDVARGKIPNIAKEMGVPAEWKHNRAGLMKVVIASVIGGALIALAKSRGRDED